MGWIVPQGYRDLIRKKKEEKKASAAIVYAKAQNRTLKKYCCLAA